jgi:hypothetical protein
MDPTPSYTTIKVTKETSEKLKALKEQCGAPSMDALLQCMVLNGTEKGASISASGDMDEACGEPAKGRRIDVRGALYSLEILSERRGMLEYYTGFDRPAVDLLIKRFREVSWRTPVFFIFVAALEPDAVHTYPRLPFDVPHVGHWK